MSFAQNGEDLVLDALLGHPQSGFYVDVGCHRPIAISNSYRFYLRGWSGLAIDGNAAFASMWRRQRPRDRFVMAAVSDKVEEVYWHDYANDALSGIGGRPFYDNKDHYRLNRRASRMARPLTDLLDEHEAPQEFEFLSVDVEGHDLKALRGLDLARYSPKVILAEANGTALDVGAIDEAEMSDYLRPYGYRPVAAHWSNVFYRRG